MKKIVMKTLLLVINISIFSSSIISAAVVPVNPRAVDSNPIDKTTTAPSVEEMKSYFNNLSHKEKKMRFKEVKKELKEYKKLKKNKREGSTDTVLLVILAILLPPLAVYLHQGVINSKFWISILLTLCFWVPGIIYALILIL